MSAPSNHNLIALGLSVALLAVTGTGPAVAREVVSTLRPLEMDKADREARERGWWSRHEEGWHFYNWTPPPEVASDESAAAPSTAQTLPPLEGPLEDPVAALKAFQEQLERAQALAVLQPTPQNVQAYLLMQKEATDRVKIFTDVGKRVAWSSPQFMPGRPLEPAGQEAWRDSYLADRKRAFQALSQRYGLLFFFRSDCPYCHQFAPFLANWARENDFDIVPISLDGGTLPEFPEPRYLPHVAERLGVTTVPAVYLADPQAREAQPLVFGMVSLGELERRIFRLTQLEPGEFYEAKTTGVAP